MEHFEMVERLQQKANVSYEEAKNALEHSDWDLLDALVYLESQGKVPKQEMDSFTTHEEKPQEKKAPEQDLRSVFTKIFDYIANLINKGNKMYLDIHRHGRLVLSVPLTVAVVLMLLFFWLLVWVMLVGFFFSLRYSFRGHPEAEKVVNKAMNKAADTAEGLKNHYRSKKKEGMAQ